MDFTKIKKFVVEHGDRFIMMEEGEPALVLMSFADYEKLAMTHQRRNGDITFQKEAFDLPTDHAGEQWELHDASETELLADDTSSVKDPRKRLEEVRLEDLPL